MTAEAAAAAWRDDWCRKNVEQHTERASEAQLFWEWGEEISSSWESDRRQHSAESESSGGNHKIWWWKIDKQFAFYIIFSILSSLLQCWCSYQRRRILHHWISRQQSSTQNFSITWSAPTSEEDFIHYSISPLSACPLAMLSKVSYTRTFARLAPAWSGALWKVNGE